MFSFEFQVDWSIFAPMNIQQPQNFKWSENVIIIDGDYVDRVAFNLIVNFERMLNRKIPSADFSQWIVDVSLDGNLKMVLVAFKPYDKSVNISLVAREPCNKESKP